MATNISKGIKLTRGKNTYKIQIQRTWLGNLAWKYMEKYRDEEIMVYGAHDINIVQNEN